MKQSLINRLCGGYNGTEFLFFVFWAMVGAFIMINIHAQTRDPKAIRTPVCFSWRIWLHDNFRRVIFNLTLILVTIRFSKEVTGKEINDFWAFVIGLSFDAIAILLNKFNLVNLIGTLKNGGNDGNPN